MDRAKKVVNEKNERILLEMTKQPGNDTCADCGAKGPRWASHNLGVFLCIRCGGLHRKMGTHISKVKSISLDSWTPEQIENMRQWGNLKANAKWNPHSELHPVPVNASDSEMERYIRNKYERQIYRDHPDKPKQSTFSSSVPPPTPPRRAANDSIIKYNNNERGNHDSALRQLKDMGFTDHARNREVLNTTNGDLSAAIEILCRLPSGSAPSASSSIVSNISSDEKLTQLWNMGFQDEAKNRDALRRTGGNVEVAAALLLEARNAESLNNNSTSSPKSNPSVNPQTEQQRMQIKLPISQSSGQSLINSSKQIPFQNTTQNSSQTILDAFGSLSSETEIQQPLTQQQQNKFDKNAILSLFSAPQQSLISHNPNSFNSINNGIPLRSASSAEQQNQFSQTQQNLVSRGVGFNSNQSILSNSTFENARTSTPSGTDLFGLNFSTSSSTMSSNEFNGLNSGFGGRMNSYEARAYDGSLISNTSNIPFRTNNADNNLFGVSMQQNSIVSPEMMANRQNSLPNFGNVTSISSFPLIENTNMSYTSMNTTSDHGIGQLQQIVPSGFGTQQISPFSNGRPNQSNGLLSHQQKNLIN
ncbi:14479_t:CDS:2, partial [Rhizophagus irregularis]